MSPLPGEVDAEIRGLHLPVNEELERLLALRCRRGAGVRRRRAAADRETGRKARHRQGRRIPTIHGISSWSRGLERRALDVARATRVTACIRRRTRWPTSTNARACRSSRGVTRRPPRSPGLFAGEGEILR